MTTEEDLSKPLTREDAHARFWREHGIELRPFAGPVAAHFPGIDRLVYLEEDCSVTAHPVAGSGISLLYSNVEPGKIVGVEIQDFAQVAAFVMKPRNGS